MNIIESTLVPVSAGFCTVTEFECYPSPSLYNSTTFVVQASRRHADALYARPDMFSRDGVATRFGRDMHAQDPICESLRDWQTLAACGTGTETIIFQGSLEDVKMVCLLFGAIFSGTCSS